MIEGVSHSICTLEFQDHRPLYDWFIEAVGLEAPVPKQTEFARLNLGYTVMSKRKLNRLLRACCVHLSHGQPTHHVAAVALTPPQRLLTSITCCSSMCAAPPAHAWELC